MSIKRIKVSLFILMMFCLSSLGCSSTNGRIRDFVDYYNQNMSDEAFKSMYSLKNTIIRETHAEILPADERGGTLKIKITFVSIFTAKSPSSQLYKQFIPKAFSSLMENNKEAKELLLQGVKFHICFNSRNGHLVKEVIIDRQNMMQYVNANSSYAYMNFNPFVNQLIS